MRNAFGTRIILTATLLSLVSVSGAVAGLDAFLDRSAGFESATIKVAEPLGITSVAASIRGEVARASFTTAIIDREPQDTVSAIGPGHEKVYYFTELANMSGRRVIHRWEYQGRVVAEVPFDVNGPRWRVYSIKTLPQGAIGEWTASTVDEDGRTLTLNTLEFHP